MNNDIFNFDETIITKEDFNVIWNEIQKRGTLSNQKMSDFNMTPIQLFYILLSKNYPNNQPLFKTDAQKIIRNIYSRLNINKDVNEIQIRHSRKQGLNWGFFLKDEFSNRLGRLLGNGEYFIESLDTSYKDLGGIETDRTAKNINKYFTIIKERCGNRCQKCGRKEGEMNGLKIIKLTKGHIDPLLPLSMTNCIPECQDCNRNGGNTNNNMIVHYYKDGRPGFQIMFSDEIQKDNIIKITSMNELNSRKFIEI